MLRTEPKVSACRFLSLSHFSPAAADRSGVSRGAENAMTARACPTRSRRTQTSHRPTAFGRAHLSRRARTSPRGRTLRRSGRKTAPFLLDNTDARHLASEVVGRVVCVRTERTFSGALASPDAPQPSRSFGRGALDLRPRPTAKACFPALWARCTTASLRRTRDATVRRLLPPTGVDGHAFSQPRLHCLTQQSCD